MFYLRGFVTSSVLMSHVPNQISPLGQLSAYSRSFSRTVSTYGLDAYPTLRLHSFSARLDATETSVDTPLQTLSLRVSQWLMNAAFSGTITDNEQECFDLLQSQFASEIIVEEIGQMVTDNTIWLPEYILFKGVGLTESETVVRLWFSDAAFRNQYDLYEIIVVSPVDDLDDLHQNRTAVAALLSSLTIPDHLMKVETVRAGIPDTLTVSENYDWVDPIDPSLRFQTPWTVITYGAAANNADLIKQTITDYVVENSSYTRTEWEAKYPDLFLPNEFYISPFWQNVALPDLSAEFGIYSPTVKHNQVMPYAVQTFHGLTESFIQANVDVSSSITKSLSFIAVGNNRNVDGVYRFSERWPSYCLLGTTTLDFNRLSPLTQGFISLLTELLLAAETMTVYSTVPTGMSRIKRGDHYYVASTYEGIQYLVFLKSNTLV